MAYIVFSFEGGDFLRDKNGKVMTFENDGLALQHIREHYLIKRKVAVTKKFTEFEQCYLAPFRLHKVVA